MKISILNYCFVIYFLWINSDMINSIEITTDSADVDSNTIMNSSSQKIRPSDFIPDTGFTRRIERNVRDELFLNCADAAAVADESTANSRCEDHSKKSEFCYQIGKPKLRLMMTYFTGNHETEIRWIKDHADLHFNSGKMEQGEWWIRIPSLQLDDAGDYTCIVAMKEPDSYINFTFEVRIYDPPEMYIRPRNITLKVGESGTFICKSSSKIPSYMEWYPGVNLNEVPTMLDLTEDQYNNVRTNDDNPEVFEFQNVAQTDQGWYSCLARNGLNTVNASAYLKVIDIGDNSETSSTDHPETAAANNSEVMGMSTMVLISGVMLFFTILLCREKRRILIFLVHKFYL